MVLFRAASRLQQTVVTRYRIALEQRSYAPSTINLRLAAVRRLTYEASDCGLLSPDLVAQGNKLLAAHCGKQLRDLRNHAVTRG